MQCKDLESVLEQDGLAPLPAEAQAHLAGCAACQGMLADFTAIVDAAATLPAEVAPPDRVWVSLRAQLEAEGLIKDQPALEPAASWWHAVSALFRPSVLAPAAAAIALSFFTYFQFHKPTVPAPAGNVGTAAAQQTVTPTSQQAIAPQSSAPTPASSVIAAKSPLQARPSDHPLKPSPSELAGSTVSTLTSLEDDVPNMRLADNAAVDASMRENLRTLNAFINECQARLKQNPQDELAREYLYNAYQQKAELLSAMMESGRSEH